MPELPEVETVARDLDAALRGAVIAGIDVPRPDVLRRRPGTKALAPQARSTLARAMGAALRGTTVHAVTRRAKSVLFELGGAGRLVIAPKMTGVFLLDGAADDPYACLRVALADGRTLVYRDVRRFGTVALLDADAFAAWDASLGPEPLDPEFDAERFRGILRVSRRPVKAVLMDPRRLVGVGNIYANEACWRAQVRPLRRADGLTRAEAGRLYEELRLVLRESIARRGTTFRDYRDAHGKRGRNAERLAVYGRAGLACLRCDAVLRASHRLDGRSTVWCPRCQR